MRRRIVEIAAFSIDFLRLGLYIIAVLFGMFPLGNSVQTMNFVLKQYDTELL